ncbi:pilus assembly protein PilX [Geomonas sp. RF6]|uniref:pilus assembly protein PilX n=1 Tax=Geomonas sp. RF6 TaxID=2897342 RepID=UPI001E5C0DD0|nr:pilus assembly protein PilX [Geomonas sp. RF6]UFS69646.1 pilus assembly protein PilX [Geomonas sp. RF6]
MAKVRGEGGAALVTALLLTLLSLVIATALLYSVTQGIKSTASHKRYSTALAAAEGGVDVLAKEIIPQLFLKAMNGPLTSDSLEQVHDMFSFDVSFPGGSAQCLQQKLSTRTEEWSACTAEGKSSDPATLPDVSFVLQGTGHSKEYQVSTKIVDTVPGNSFLGGFDLDAGGAVDWKDEEIYPQHVPYLYSIGVQGETTDLREKARLSVLYAY